MKKYEQETTLTIRLPETFKDAPSELRDLLARDLLRTIKKRTEDGLDKNDANFVPYSSSYKKSNDFKLAGKSSSHVNLRLLGEMMGNLKVLNTTETAIVFGFSSAQERAKAHGHITGHNGEVSKKGHHYPVRDFLGLPSDVVQSLFKKYEDTGKLTDAANLVRRVTGETQIKKPQPKSDRGFQGKPLDTKKPDRGFDPAAAIQKRQESILNRIKERQEQINQKVQQRAQSTADKILERMGLVVLVED